jgi:hypothetical protein
MTLQYRSTPGDMLRLGQGRLSALGISLLVMGCSVALVAIGMLLPTYAGNQLVAHAYNIRYVKAPAPRWSIYPFIVLGVVATVCIWSGLGSLWRQRWTRPVVISFAGILAFGSAVTLLQTLLLFLGDSYVSQPAPATPMRPSVATSSQTMAPAVVAAIYILGVTVQLIVTLSFLFIYRSQPIEMALDETDPVIRWTDRTPLPLLALAIACLWTALLTLTRYVSPPIGYFFSDYSKPLSNESIETIYNLSHVFRILLAGLLVAAAFSIYRQRTEGPWLAIAALVIIAASITLYGTDLVNRERNRQRPFRSPPVVITISARDGLKASAYAIPALLFVLYAWKSMPSKISPQPLPTGAPGMEYAQTGTAAVAPLPPPRAAPSPARATGTSGIPPRPSFPKTPPHNPRNGT